MKTRPRRGVEDIRIRTNLCADMNSPHRRYLKVANLELRKSLCNAVRRAALLRVVEMNRQLAAIEAEQAKLLEAASVGGQDGSKPADEELLAELATSPERRGFTIKY